MLGAKIITSESGRDLDTYLIMAYELETDYVNSSSIIVTLKL